MQGGQLSIRTVLVLLFVFAGAVSIRLQNHIICDFPKCVLFRPSITKLKYTGLALSMVVVVVLVSAMCNNQ